jgi:hypothetical protein
MGKSIYRIGKKFLEGDSAKAAAEFKSISIQKNETGIKLPLKTSTRQRMIFGFMANQPFGPVL